MPLIECGPAEALKFMVTSCCVCHKIRTDNGYWCEGGDLLKVAPRNIVTHTVCPECLRVIYPEHADMILSRLEVPAS